MRALKKLDRNFGPLLNDQRAKFQNYQPWQLKKN